METHDIIIAVNSDDPLKQTKAISAFISILSLHRPVNSIVIAAIIERGCCSEKSSYVRSLSFTAIELIYRNEVIFWDDIRHAILTEIATADNAQSFIAALKILDRIPDSDLITMTGSKEGLVNFRSCFVHKDVILRSVAIKKLGKLLVRVWVAMETNVEVEGFIKVDASADARRYCDDIKDMIKELIKACADGVLGRAMAGDASHLLEDLPIAFVAYSAVLDDLMTRYNLFSDISSGWRDASLGVSRSQQPSRQRHEQAQVSASLCSLLSIALPRIFSNPSLLIDRWRRMSCEVTVTSFISNLVRVITSESCGSFVGLMATTATASRFVSDEEPEDIADSGRPLLPPHIIEFASQWIHLLGCQLRSPYPDEVLLIVRNMLSITDDARLAATRYQLCPCMLENLLRILSIQGWSTRSENSLEAVTWALMSARFVSKAVLRTALVTLCSVLAGEDVDEVSRIRLLTEIALLTLTEPARGGRIAQSDLAMQLLTDLSGLSALTNYNLLSEALATTFLRVASHLLISIMNDVVNNPVDTQTSGNPPLQTTTSSLWALRSSFDMTTGALDSSPRPSDFLVLQHHDAFAIGFEVLKLFGFSLLTSGGRLGRLGGALVAAFSSLLSEIVRRLRPHGDEPSLPQTPSVVSTRCQQKVELESLVLSATKSVLSVGLLDTGLRGKLIRVFCDTFPSLREVDEPGNISIGQACLSSIREILLSTGCDVRTSSSTQIESLTSVQSLVFGCPDVAPDALEVLYRFRAILDERTPSVAGVIRSKVDEIISRVQSLAPGNTGRPRDPSIISARESSRKIEQAPVNGHKFPGNTPGNLIQLSNISTASYSNDSIGNESLAFGLFTPMKPKFDHFSGPADSTFVCPADVLGLVDDVVKSHFHLETGAISRQYGPFSGAELNPGSTMLESLGGVGDALDTFGSILGPDIDWIQLSGSADLLTVFAKTDYDPLQMSVSVRVRVTNTSGFKIPYFVLHAMVATGEVVDDDAGARISGPSADSIVPGVEYFFPGAFVERVFKVRYEKFTNAGVILRISFPDTLLDDATAPFRSAADRAASTSRTEDKLCLHTRAVTMIDAAVECECLALPASALLVPYSAGSLTALSTWRNSETHAGLPAGVFSSLWARLLCRVSIPVASVLSEDLERVPLDEAILLALQRRRLHTESELFLRAMVDSGSRSTGSLMTGLVSTTAWCLQTWWGGEVAIRLSAFHGSFAESPTSSSRVCLWSGQLELRATDYHVIKALMRDVGHLIHELSGGQLECAGPAIGLEKVHPANAFGALSPHLFGPSDNGLPCLRTLSG